MSWLAFFISLSVVSYLLVGRGIVLYRRHFNQEFVPTSAMFYLPLVGFIGLCELTLRGEDWIIQNIQNEEDEDE